MIKKITVILLLVQLKYISWCQFKDLNNELYFDNPSFYNPSNIKLQNENRYAVLVYFNTPLSSDFDGLRKNSIFNFQAQVGKSGALGLIAQQTTNALIAEYNASVYYGYLINFNDQWKLSLGVNLGVLNAQINSPNSNTNQDPLVVQFNKTNNFRLFQDLGLTVFYNNFEFQLVKYNVSNQSNDPLVLTEPSLQLEDGWLTGFSYTLEKSNYTYRCFMNYQNYNRGNFAKYSIGNRFSLKPIAFDLIWNSYNIITAGTAIFLTKKLQTNLYYNFGSFFASPIYDNNGYVGLGLKFDF